MDNQQFPITISCPWCEKSETLANKPADIKVSCKCSVCGKYYHIDFNILRAVKAKPKTRISGKFKKLPLKTI